MQEALPPQRFEQIHNAISSNLKDSIEYIRATHSEMASIIDAARRGHKISGCTIYTNTHPCHLCIKHIIAAGIKKIVYLAPYPKNKCFEMFEDIISQKKILVEAFIGVSPSRYNYVFDQRFQNRYIEDTQTCEHCIIKKPKFDQNYCPKYIQYNWPDCYKYKENQIINLYNALLKGRSSGINDWASAVCFK